MKPSQALQQIRAAIRKVVDAHRARNARVFGSVAHGSDTEESDLNILVAATPDTTLFDIGAIRHELRTLLGVPVDKDRKETVECPHPAEPRARKWAFELPDFGFPRLACGIGVSK